MLYVYNGGKVDYHGNNKFLNDQGVGWLIYGVYSF